MLSLVLSDLSELLIPTSSLPLPLMSSGFDSSKKLSLTFNDRIFYILSDIIAHIYNYLEDEERVALYVDVVKQVEKIFDIRLTFMEGLIKTIKKD